MSVWQEGAGLATGGIGERILAAAGVALAGSAAVFAFVMVERGERSLFWAPVSPYIDSLAIGSPGPGPEVDPIITGSIGAPAGPQALPDGLSSAYFAAPIEDYVVRDIRNGVALVLSSKGYRSVRPGEILPGAGRVEHLEVREGRMLVVTSQGIIDETRN
jgi:hypothetical protein